MADTRDALRNGDKTSTNGILIATGRSAFHHNVTLGVEGDYATCPACKVGGPVMNDCYPAFDIHGKQVLVSGARVFCKCSTKPFVIPSQRDFTIEVNRGGYRGAAPIVPTSNLAPDASNKFVEDMQNKQYAEDESLICPNMSNVEFHATMMQLRDKAVRLLNDRLAELSRWNQADQDKVTLWFGHTSGNMRKTLRDGLTGIRDVMGSLREKNFERHSEEGLRRVGCVPRARDGEIEATASVCKPDGTYTIFVGPKFCRLDYEQNSPEGIPFDSDSKLTVLIHEVSHFPEAMNSEDKWYNILLARLRAKARNQFCIVNADNIAYYVTNIPNWSYRPPAWKP